MLRPRTTLLLLHISFGRLPSNVQRGVQRWWDITSGPVTLNADTIRSIYAARADNVLAFTRGKQPRPSPDEGKTECALSFLSLWPGKWPLPACSNATLMAVVRRGVDAEHQLSGAVAPRRTDVSRFAPHAAGTSSFGFSSSSRWLSPLAGCG